MACQDDIPCQREVRTQNSVVNEDSFHISSIFLYHMVKLLLVFYKFKIKRTHIIKINNEYLINIINLYFIIRFYIYIYIK